MNPVSTVETFVAMEVFVDDWTWIGVPFYLRTGKSLAETRRTITIGFREPPLKVFPGDVDDTCNELVLDLTDDPKIFADVRSKIPGPRFALGRARMRLDLLASFPGAEPWRRTNGCCWTCCAATRPSPSRLRRSSCCGGCSIRCCGIRRNRAAIRGIPGARTRPCDFRGHAAGGCPTRRAERGLSTRDPLRGPASLNRVPPRYRDRALPALAAGPA